MKKGKIGEKETLPPSSNTGVELTRENGLKLTVDWVEGTSFKFSAEEVIEHILGYPYDNFVLTEKGALGYMNGLRDGNITIWYNGREGMGVHFTLTGEGCRQYENVLKECENPIKKLLEIINSDEKIKLSRLDLAIDDFEGIFSIPNLVRKVKNGELISKFKRARRIEDILVSDGSSKGTTLYFGSPKSNILIRMYEKNYQMGLEDKIPKWNRTEIQLRDDKAMAALREICSDKSFGEVCFGILKHYIRFVDIPVEDRKKWREGKKTIRKDRYPENKKWLEFIGKVEGLRLTVEPKEITMEDKYNHLLKQASKAFYMLETAGYSETDDILRELRMKGFKSLKKEDISIIKKYQEQQEELESWRKWVEQDENDSGITP